MSLRADVHLSLGSLRLDAELAAEPGEVVAVVGPNGAGKTTLLRALAGLVPLDRGRIELDSEVLDDSATGHFVPPERRPVGVVFQDYLLFPHLSALENVAFGLRTRRRRDAHSEARRWLDRMGLGDIAGRRPRELSGGQAQRVALARALAYGPRLLLLDEPLAALDVSARGELRRELRTHLSQFAGVRLLVTHDPIEAAALAGRLVVLEEGQVVQAGSFAELTSRPRSRYVADLVGVNLWRGVGGQAEVRVLGHSVAVAEAPSGDVFALLRPRAVALHRERPQGSPRNAWAGRVTAIDAHGERVRVVVEGPLPVVAEVTPAALAELRLAAGDQVWIAFKATEVEVYEA